MFDTQAAQAALGRSSSSSLADLWAIHTRHRMSAAEKRRLQSSDWRTRPLSDEQLRYAAADASLLPCVYASQLAALSRAGVDLALLRSQAATLCRRRYELPSFDREDARRRFWQLAPDTAHGLDQAAVACAEGAFVAAMQWRDSVVSGGCTAAAKIAMPSHSLLPGSGAGCELACCGALASAAAAGLLQGGAGPGRARHGRASRQLAPPGGEG